MEPKRMKPLRRSWAAVARAGRLGALAAAVAVAALAAGGQATDGRAPARATNAADDRPTNATPYVFGARYCAKCHSEEQSEKGSCRMIEASIWRASDPHRAALAWARIENGSFATPSGARAAAIGQRLGIADASTSPRCVGCHSVRLDDAALQQAFDPSSEGVTCVACHGAYDPWVTQHQVVNKPTWKQLSPAEKWLEYGMVNLRDPITRAATCVSCHVGNPDPASGQWIAHDIYAAGRRCSSLQARSSQCRGCIVENEASSKPGSGGWPAA
jgi:hypothetical protein